MKNSKILNILFIHHELPGQFIHLIRYLSNHPQYNVFGISNKQDDSFYNESLFQKAYTYQPKEIEGSLTHHYVTDLQRSVLNAQAIFDILQKFKQHNIDFDLAVAHTGWGGGLYFKEAYPATPLLGYVEFFFHLDGADVGFDPKFPVSIDRRLQIKTLNAQLLLGMNECDGLVTPTPWQKSLFPDIWHSKINVIHEGVDVDLCKPDNQITFTLPSGQELTGKDEVVTYSARNLEPYRGFPIFLKAIERICQRRPNCHIIITGGDEISYSKKLPKGETYREKYLKTVSLPKDKVHFLGKVPYKTHLQLLQLSSVHIYLTYPFVLSWSFMEAMACGCVIIASGTRPVLDVLEPGVNGISVNFFDDEQIADQIDDVFKHPERKKQLGLAARDKIKRHYQHQFSINQYLLLFKQLIEKNA